VEAGIVTYVFPQPASGPTYNYTEAFIGGSFDKVTSRLYYTNSYFGGGPGTYVELNGNHAITDHISIVDFLAGVTAEVKGFTFGLSVVGTNAPQDACPATTGKCSTTVVVSVSHNF
jgi:hypothetical protein